MKNYLKDKKLIVKIGPPKKFLFWETIILVGTFKLSHLLISNILVWIQILKMDPKQNFKFTRRLKDYFCLKTRQNEWWCRAEKAAGTAGQEEVVQSKLLSSASQTEEEERKGWRCQDEGTACSINCFSRSSKYRIKYP